MYSFKNDYAEGAHPAILDALVASNLVQQAGYGEDVYGEEAKALLKVKMQNPEADIYFVSGGTQANLLVISALLRPHEAVISANTGHIYTNEAGAIEAAGHKVIAVASDDGKLTAASVAATVAAYGMRPHVVKPKLVYISNSTEIGSLYTRAELKELWNYCTEAGLYLFVDGARLGHALTAIDNDLTLADMAKLSHVFYIGGTKNGALLGEAIVFNKPDLAPDFAYVVKQRGALLAKGRILGVQFLTLFTDDLYLELAQQANILAAKMAAAFEAKGYDFLTKPQTNQIFPILPHALIEHLSAHYAFFVWKAIDSEKSAIRLITSWATEPEQVDLFIKAVEGWSC